MLWGDNVHGDKRLPKTVLIGLQEKDPDWCVSHQLVAGDSERAGKL